MKENIISVKKNLHENDIVHEVQALKVTSKLCHCIDDNGQDLNVDDIPELFLNNIEYTEEMTDKWISIKNYF